MFYGMIEFLKETLDISTIMFFCFTGSLYYAFLYASIRAIMDVVFIRMPSPHAKLQAEASVQLDLHLPKGFHYSRTLRKMVRLFFSDFRPLCIRPETFMYLLGVSARPQWGHNFAKKYWSVSEEPGGLVFPY